MSKINDYNNEISNYLEKINNIPEKIEIPSLLSKKLEELVAQLKATKAINYKNKKVYTINVFKVYQRTNCIIKSLRFNQTYFQQLFDWFEKCYKYGYGNIDYCKNFIQFHIWMDTFCENLEAFTDSDIDCADEYIPLLNIDEYYDYIKFILIELQKYAFRWENLKELITLQEKLPNLLSKTLKQVLRKDLSIDKIQKIIEKLKHFLQLSEAQKDIQLKKVNDEIVDLISKISENDKINNAAIQTKSKIICDLIWIQGCLTQKQISEKLYYSVPTIKDYFKEIYDYFNISGTGNNKQKELLNILRL